jgi:TolB protein
MVLMRKRVSIATACLVMLTVPTALAASPSLGIFQDHQDVGTVLHPGSVEYNAAQLD